MEAEVLEKNERVFFTSKKHGRTIEGNIVELLPGTKSARVKFSETIPGLFKNKIQDVPLAMLDMPDRKIITSGIPASGETSSLHSSRLDKDLQPYSGDYKKLEYYRTVFKSAQEDEKGFYIPSSANTAEYIENKFREKGINVKIVDSVNDGTDLYDMYFEETESTENIKPETANPSTNLQLMSNDRWYELHPDKILGTPVQVSTRFISMAKGGVTSYKGTLADALARIDADVSILQNNLPELVTIQESDLPVREEDSFANVNAAISDEKKQETAEKKKTRKSKKQKLSNLAEPQADVYTPQEIFEKYNPNITIDELRCFLYYKRSIGQPILNMTWIDIAYPGENGFVESRDHSDLQIKQWVKDGLLYYYHGDLIPGYLYFAEYIWEKRTALNSDKENIISTYGEEVFNRQQDQLINIFNVSYQKRLTLTDNNVSNRLKILPISNFAKDFFITSLNDEKEFKIKEVTATGKKDYGKMDAVGMAEGRGRTWDRKEVEKLSLTDAFQYWLINYRDEYEIRKDTDYLEIIRVYVRSASRPRIPEDTPAAQKKAAEAAWQRKQNLTKEEGDRLFAEFLSSWLKTEDIVRIETLWNEKYNGYLYPDWNKVPVLFTCAKEYRGEPVDVRPEKRESCAFLFNNGNGLLAYDVGVGKTWCALFAISQYLDAGYCSRPFIVVPNQTYRQWIGEAKGLLPHLKINDLYNLSDDYVQELMGADGKIHPVDAGSLSIMTYEGLERIGFGETTTNKLVAELYEILDQNPEGVKKTSKREEAGLREKLLKIIGRALNKTLLDIEWLGFDMVTYDESHKMKKVFTGVKGEMKGDGDRDKNPYSIASGTPSAIALKGFMITHYILKNNSNRNVIMLTATPFTNSPLEIYSVLSMIAYDIMKKQGINNLKSFFDTFCDARTMLVINAQMKPQYKQIVLSFNNLQALQQLVRRAINYKTGEGLVVRPNKWVLPMDTKVENGEVIKLPANEHVLTYLPMTPQQSAWMDDIRAYVESKSESLVAGPSESEQILEEFANPDLIEEEDTTETIDLDEESLSTEEKLGVRIIKGINYARNLALSPYLYVLSGMRNPTAEQYIESSPKLTYVTQCIKQVLEHHKKTNTPASGQVIYMDRGIKFFHLIKEYLVTKFGLKEHEVGIIRSQMPGGKNAKENIKNKFLGLRFDEASGEFVDIPDDQRIKVLIGSSTIKEGMNLQRYSTVLYNCFLDWNPTDIKQLEGRIWRQGNMFKNVRVVNPLMQDSMDIFIFQKLQEKTSRLISIWDTNSDNNTFDLEEFNPEEMKLGLIKDPRMIAEIQIKQDVERFDDELRAVKNEIIRVEKIIEDQEYYNSHISDFIEWVETYRPARIIKEEGAPEEAEGKKEERKFTTLVTLMNEIIKTQTDKDGLPMEPHYNRRGSKKYSDEDPAYKPHYANELILSYRNLERSKKEYFQPKGLKIEKADIRLGTLRNKQADMEKHKEKMGDEKAIAAITKDIIAQREENKIEEKSVFDRVKEFNRLNYLLDDVRIKKPASESQFDFCPPMDEKGNRRIDEEALVQMDTCLAKAVDTKHLHTNAAGEYTDERKDLHANIVKQYLDKAQCIKHQQPIAILTGGPPGAGKTTFLRKNAPWLLSGPVLHIDADDIRSKLPEYKGWNSNATHFETRDIVKDLIAHAASEQCRYDIVYDGTMNRTKNYIPLIDRLKKYGYKIFVIYINLPKEESVKRVLNRYVEQGRYVPMYVLDEVFTAGKGGYNEVKGMTDGYIEVDGLTGKVIGKGGEKIPEDRNYKQLTGTDDFTRSRELEIAKAKAAARNRRIRILAMGGKAGKELRVSDSGKKRVEYKIPDTATVIHDATLFGDDKPVVQSKKLSKKRNPGTINEIELYYNKVPLPNVLVKTSKDAYDFAMSMWAKNNLEIQEEFMVMYLNRENRLIGYDIPFKGGVAGTVVDPKIVFGTAAKAIASGIIIFHNHPSGNTRPSEDDIRLSKRMKQAGKDIDIPLLDHIIVTKDKYFSMNDEGLI